MNSLGAREQYLCVNVDQIRERLNIGHVVESSFFRMCCVIASCPHVVQSLFYLWIKTSIHQVSYAVIESSLLSKVIEEHFNLFILRPLGKGNDDAIK